MKKKLINAVVKKLNNISVQSMGTSSVLFFHQPKEPANLNKIIKNKQ